MVLNALKGIAVDLNEYTFLRDPLVLVTLAYQPPLKQGNNLTKDV